MERRNTQAEIKARSLQGRRVRSMKKKFTRVAVRGHRRRRVDYKKATDS